MCKPTAHSCPVRVSVTIFTAGQPLARCLPLACVRYDVEGRKLEKRGRRDRLEKHIAKADALGKVGLYSRFYASPLWVGPRPAGGRWTAPPPPASPPQRQQ